MFYLFTENVLNVILCLEYFSDAGMILMKKMMNMFTLITGLLLIFLLTACHAALPETLTIAPPRIDFMSMNTRIYEAQIQLMIYEPPPLPVYDVEEAPEPEPEPIRRPMVALTFDDGPSLANTGFILDVLADHDAKATFFVLGSRVEAGAELINRMFDEGHEVAGHSWGHPRLTGLGIAGITREITRTSDIIRDVSGNEPAVFFRAPYGAINNNVINVARDLGYALIRWSVDPKDWDVRCAEHVYNEVMRAVVDGSIILLHDIHVTTAMATARIVPRLIEMGFDLVTVSELLADVYGEIEPGVEYSGNRYANQSQR